MTAASATSPELPRLRIARVAPRLYRGLAALGDEVELDGRLSELVKLRASILNGCAYCIDLHTKLALEAGESERRLRALVAWRESSFFDDRERAALALTDAVTLIADDRVPPEVWEEAHRRFEPRELAHLVWAITLINAWNRIAIATRMAPAS
jgi:AhpD family alkylhydroperoxidase